MWWERNRAYRPTETPSRKGRQDKRAQEKK